MFAMLLSFLLLPLTSARSDGAVGECNAHANFGCSEWNTYMSDRPGFPKGGQLDDRLDCIDQNPGYMPWATRPDRSDKYTLRTESGTSHYQLGELLTLVMEVNDANYKYRGLLVHAVDEDGTDVGSWEYPSEGEEHMWTPPTCPKAALHVNADLKPYSVRLHWRAPDDLDGPVTFRALIKRGPANHGSFHYPNGRLGDLTITPMPFEDEVKFNVVGGAGLSCTQACRRSGRQGVTAPQCDESAMRALNSATAVHRAMPSCPLPILKGCSALATATEGADEYETCSYGAQLTSGNRCNQRQAGVQQICSCVGSQIVAGRRLLEEDLTEMSAPEVATASKTADQSAIVALGFIGAVVFAFVFMMQMSRKKMSTTALALTMLAKAPVVEAHNWLFTTGRATRLASTTAPCRARKSSDTHAQVGPNQSINMMWATGHDGDHYVVVLKGQDYHELENKNFNGIVQDYINKAPNGNNVAQDPYHQRYHAVNRNMNNCNSGRYANRGMFTGVVPADDPNFLTHPDSQTTCQWQFTADRIRNDRHVNYDSNEYPWLKSAAKYTNQFDAAVDYDVSRVTFDERLEPGHYIVHWRWRGYYDCVDVDVHANPVPAPIIYGEDSGNHVFARVDHCQYIKPTYIMSSCYEVVDSIDQCVNALERWSGVTDQMDVGDVFSQQGRVRARQERLGVQVMPAVLPELARFGGELGFRGLPTGNNPVCGRSDWLELTGKGTVTTKDQGSWEEGWLADSVQVRANRRCNQNARLWNMRTTLRDAVALCARSDCVGISGEFTDATQAFTGLHNFWGCSATGVNTAGWTWLGKNMPTTNLPLNQPVANINFARAGVTLSGAEARTFTLLDGGHVFGPRNGKKYGWVCPGEQPAGGIVPRVFSNDRGFGANSGTADGTAADALFRSRCPQPDEETQWDMRWEYEVPSPGVYHVEARIGGGNGGGGPTPTSGCSVEGSQFNPNGRRQPTKGVFSVDVEVRDGNLTFGAQTAGIQTRCKGINWMKITKKSNGYLPDAWVPPSRDPWWQQELPERTKVGAVVINTMSSNGKDCSSRFLFKGASCAGDAPILGEFFDEDNEGAIVGVSDRPCPANGKCSGTVCGRIMRAKASCLAGPSEDGGKSMDCQNANNFLQTTVDCHGAEGKYVWVQLPGERRVLAALDVKINRHLPEKTSSGRAVGPDTMVCYGVQARVQTAVAPEFETVTDPEDPIFYSTCYVRERDLTWLKVTPEPEPDTRWRFNGKCVECEDVKVNSAMADFPPPQWRLASECRNCDLPVEDQCTTQSTPVTTPTTQPRPQPTPDPTRNPTNRPRPQPTPDPTRNPTNRPRRPAPTPNPTRNPTNRPRPTADPTEPAAPKLCEPWCPRNTQPWQYKCGWRRCNGCDDCLTVDEIIYDMPSPVDDPVEGETPTTTDEPVEGETPTTTDEPETPEVDPITPDDRTGAVEGAEPEAEEEGFPVEMIAMAAGGLVGVVLLCVVCRLCLVVRGAYKAEGDKRRGLSGTTAGEADFVEMDNEESSSADLAITKHNTPSWQQDQ